MIRVTRRYPFSAAHVLARPDWDAERNRSVYGKCAHPGSHGHNYVLEVTVRGELDPESGRILPLGRLDAAVDEHVLQSLDHRFLNREVEAFEKCVPTAENIARYAWRALQGRLAPAELDKVRVVETSHNSAECVGEELEA